MRREFCPHCLRRLDMLGLVPWFELLRCEWSGRAYLKVHDLKWAFALAALTPAAVRALVCAGEDERSAALALVRTFGESEVDVTPLEEHLRARVEAGSIPSGAREGARRGFSTCRAARPIARRARASGNDLPAAAHSLADRHDVHRRHFMQEAADR